MSRGSISRHRGAVPRAVFVDGTGRRRRAVTVAGAGLAVALLVALGLLISGLLGRSPLRLPGLPNDAGAPAPAAVHSSSGAAPSTPKAQLVPSLIPTPPAASRAPSRAPSAGQASPAATERGRRPSQTPAHPVQSKRK